MTCHRFLTAVALLAAAAWQPALAADATFPPGVLVGLAPLIGLSRAKSFAGFESEDQSVKVLVTELPADAFNEVSAAFKANPAGVGGVKPEKIETPAGIRNLEAIADVEGVDVVFAGPLDLSASLGHIGQIGHPEVQPHFASIMTVSPRVQKIALSFTATAPSNPTRFSSRTARSARCLSSKMAKAGWSFDTDFLSMRSGRTN